MTRKTNQKGFTLIELLITVAIVAILATIALPAYNQYRDRAKYAEVIHASEPAKTMIDVCVQTGSPPAGCQTLVPAAGIADAAAVNTVVIGGTATTGPYTVTVTPAPVAGYGITATDTYIAEGTVNTTNQTVNWAIRSDAGCLAAGYC